jgi:cation transport protein ChaC
VTWVFAYGSLMGDAVLGRYRARPARLPGYRRAFLHESRRRWGTPASPCPILGLAPAPGDECWGLVFEIPDAERRPVENAL